MSKALRANAGSILWAAVAIAAMLALLGGAPAADPVEISTGKTVLSPQGEGGDFLATMPMSIGGGHLLTGANGTLSLNGQVVAEAISVRYSYIDDRLVISFDRDQLLSHPSVKALAGTPVTATVEGSFTAANSDGDSYKQAFRGTSRKLSTS